MVDYRQGEHRPIQTSAVIVLGANKGPSLPPPSPPTPFRSPSSASICEPADSFMLEDECTPSNEQASCSNAPDRLLNGLHVLGTEADALQNITKLYETDSVARDGFDKSVTAITGLASSNGKLVIIGVGKSGHIGKKLVATFQSLSIRAVFLHPTEALHGDLGVIAPNDVLLFITYSGSTQELMQLLPHLDESLPTILITSHTRTDTCKFLQQRPNTILLPAPVHQTEKDSFGVSAPTTSTTVALVVGDALAITAANELHPSTAAVFAKNHPGGAIGEAAKGPQTLGQLAVPWTDIHDPAGLGMHSTGLDLLRSGYNSKSGWVILEEDLIATPSCIRSLSNEQLNLRIEDFAPGLLVSRQQMLDLSAETTLRQAKDMLRDKLHACNSILDEDDVECELESVIAVMANGTISGVLQVQDVLDYE